MSRVEIYTKNYCPFCHRAKALLDSKGIVYDEYDLVLNPALESEMHLRSQRQTVPQVFIDGLHIGGSDDLLEADRNGKLDRMLMAKAA